MQALSVWKLEKAFVIEYTIIYQENKSTYVIYESMGPFLSWSVFSLKNICSQENSKLPIAWMTRT